MSLTSNHYSVPLPAHEEEAFLNLSHKLAKEGVDIPLARLIRAALIAATAASIKEALKKIDAPPVTWLKRYPLGIEVYRAGNSRDRKRTRYRFECPHCGAERFGGSAHVAQAMRTKSCKCDKPYRGLPKLKKF